MKVISSREFSEWKYLFNEEDERKLHTREKWEYYAASIAYHIVLMNAKDIKQVKFDDFFFDYDAKKHIATPLTEEQKKEKRKTIAMASKMKWGAICKTPLLKIDREKCQQKIS